MPKYVTPRTDISRLTFMAKAVQTATDEAAAVAATGGGTTMLNPALLADLTAHYNAFKAASSAVKTALGNRKAETAESVAAMNKLKMYSSHLRTAVRHRALREEQPARIFDFYGLNSDGTQPTFNSRRERLLAAEALIAGDAEAVAAGYAPIVAPSAAELQVVYDAAMAQAGDLPAADKAYDEAQAAVAALRPQADKLIKAVRAAILYATYEMDAPSQRRVLRNYGSEYYYAPAEKVDDGDETAVFEVGAEVVAPSATHLKGALHFV